MLRSELEQVHRNISTHKPTPDKGHTWINILRGAGDWTGTRQTITRERELCLPAVR